jgi:electron transport complex protein RnfD
MAPQPDTQPQLLNVSVSPHLRDKVTVPRIMWSVVLALVPALFGSVYFFGPRALWLVVAGILSAVITEALCQKIRKKPVTVTDGSAVVTGILLTFCLPPGVPWWLPVLGSAFAIAIGKQVFGGLGHNPFNPALLGRAFLLASWPLHMTTDWRAPSMGTLSGIDVITSATPLSVLKEAHKILANPAATTEQMVQAREALAQLSSSYGNLFWGNIGGSLGETSAILLLIGGLYLMFKRYIGWKIPLTFMGTVMIITGIFGGTDGLFTGDVLFHLLSGGLVLGAFFMATDMVTTPVTYRGRLIFGTGCGVITSVIRLAGGYPEGVCYSILLMNACTPLIDRWTKPRILGTGRRKQAS